MSFLRTLLMFVFVFSLVGVGGSYAGKIRNCSTCIIKAMSNERLCKMATIENDKNILVWDEKNYSYHVKVAKSRNLKCGVGTKKTTTNIAKSLNEDLKKDEHTFSAFLNKRSEKKRPLAYYANSTICFNATIKLRFSKSK